MFLMGPVKGEFDGSLFCIQEDLTEERASRCQKDVSFCSCPFYRWCVPWKIEDKETMIL